jgi:hypothetical protein
LPSFVNFLSIIGHSTVMWKGLGNSEQPHNSNGYNAKQPTKKAAAKKASAKKGTVKNGQLRLREESRTASFFSHARIELSTVRIFLSVFFFMS